MKISILGDGAWGSAIANLLSQNGNNVAIWGPFESYLREMSISRRNPKFLPDFVFDQTVSFCANLELCIKQSEILILALPTQYQRRLIESIKPYINHKHILINIAKGIENETLDRISQIITEIIGNVKYAVLSGPSHAEEVAKCVPSALSLGTHDDNLGKMLQKLFTNDYFRVYISHDVTGIELGGALKNVFAIAAGISDGLKLGDNSKAALVTRSIAEMTRLGKVLGGKFETFSGLSGIGDLLVTCYSKYSRNRFVGEGLGKGQNLLEIQSELGMKVAEGVKTTKSAYQLARRCHIETPIIDELYQAIYEEKPIHKIVKDLMSRPAKPEVY